MKVAASVLLLLVTSGVCAQTQPPRPFVRVDPAHPPVAGATISAQQLLLPSKAVRELRRAQTAFASGDVRSSAHHLEKALQIFPDCPEARNNLGSRYIELHQYEKAAEEFQKAGELDPRLMQPVNNLSVALFLLARYAQAETAARRALDLDPQNPTARYMLGASLTMQGRGPDEAIRLLRQTTREYPDAWLLLATVLTRQGNLEEAANELREYLKAPAPEKKENVQRWLARLEQQSAVTSRAGQVMP